MGSSAVLALKSWFGLFWHNSLSGIPFFIDRPFFWFKSLVSFLANFLFMRFYHENRLGMHFFCGWVGGSFPIPWSAPCFPKVLASFPLSSFCQWYVIPPPPVASPPATGWVQPPAQPLRLGGSGCSGQGRPQVVHKGNHQRGWMAPRTHRFSLRPLYPSLSVDKYPPFAAFNPPL